MDIRYVKQQNIDRKKWDACIENSVNCMVYAMSWYLDVVCENWDALISNDYEAVMPLPWKKKYGIKYIYHPFFAQQLGVFYLRNADDQIYDFLMAIPKSFLKYETSLNYLNGAKNLALNIHTNYILPLNKSYAELYKNFNQNARRNLKKAEKENFSIKSVPVIQFIKLKKENPVNKLQPTHFKILEHLFNTLISKGNGLILGGYNSHNELLAAACFVHFKNRIIYLFSASNAKGKEKRAMFKLINQVISENANRKVVLDFEGSMIPSVARFFKGFGAQTETYYRLHKSKIPFIK